MPYKPITRCNICKLIEGGDRELFKRIYNSRYFVPKAPERLSHIQADYAGFFNLVSLQNHCRKHQTFDEVETKKRSLERIEHHAQEIAVKQTAKPMEVWDDVIEKAKQELAEGNMKLTANHLLKATKDKSDFEFKKKDQELKLAEMIFHFASGEASESDVYDRRIIEGQTPTDFNAATITAGSIAEVENRPGDFCEPPAGDAAPLRASEVFKKSS